MVVAVAVAVATVLAHQQKKKDAVEGETAAFGIVVYFALGWVVVRVADVDVVAVVVFAEALV